MKNLVLYAILSIFLSYNSYAQHEAQYLKSNLNTYSTSLINFYNDVRTIKIAEDDNTHNFNGSPYLDENFYKGSLITKDSLLYTGVYLRYNNYKDVMEFKKDNGVYEISHQFPLVQVMLNGKIYEPYTYTLNDELRLGYFQQLYKGNCSLYSKNNIIFLEGKPAKGYKEASLPTFKNTGTTFYIRDNENKLTEIKTKKDLLILFSSNKEKVSDFIKKHNIKVKYQSDMIRLIEYCNQLNE